jgi:hypothetical protein
MVSLLHFVAMVEIEKDEFFAQGQACIYVPKSLG